MRHNLVWTALFALFICTSAAKADLVDFAFLNDGPLDGSGPVGRMQTGEAGMEDGVTTTLTVTEILAPEYDNSVRTGNILSAANDMSNLPVTSNNNDAIGINNASINNGDFDALGETDNNGTEGNDFNPDEALFFTFDEDVTFTQVEFESFQAGDSFVVSVAGADIVTFTDNDVITDLGGLSGLLITSGTEVGFRAEGSDETTSIRIEGFQVDVAVAVPEPSSMALIGLLGIGVITRRRR